MKGYISLPGLPKIPRPENLNDLHLLAPSILRLGRGLVAHSPAREPERPVELFQREGCAFCRKVRDVLTELDLGYVARTVNGPVPRLFDPNVGTVIEESEAIIDHLQSTYGSGRPRWQRLLGPLDSAGSSLATAVRRRATSIEATCEGRTQPEQLIELWSFEASPYCRKAREALTELGLDHRVHNVGKRGRRRKELVALGGKMQVPYLVDPNTGVAMYESEDIVAYLRRTYG